MPERHSFEHWAYERLRCRMLCRVNRGQTCIPLRTDKACGKCYEESTRPDNREPEKTLPPGEAFI